MTDKVSNWSRGNKAIIVPILVTVFFFGFFLTLAKIVTDEVQKVNKERTLAKYAVESQEGLTMALHEVGEYSTLLLSARGLFNSSEKVERDEWAAFASSLGLEENYVVGSTLEYISRIEGGKNQSSDSKTKFVDKYVVEYVDPVAPNEQLMGKDLYVDETVKKTIELARDTGMAVITPPIEERFGGEDQRRFLMMMAVYKGGENVETLDARREHIKGLVLTSVPAGELFTKIMRTTNFSSLEGVSVADITDGPISLVSFVDRYGKLTSIRGLSTKPVAQRSRVNIGGRLWELSFRSEREDRPVGLEALGAWLILGFGIIMSGLVGLVLLNSLRLRKKAEELADSLTSDLKKFRLAVEAASDQIVITDAEGIILYANPATSVLTGYEIDEVMGTKAGKLWGGLMEKEFYQKMWHTIKEEKKVFIGELRNKKKNGVVYDTSVKISPILDDNGSVNFFMSIERDISREKDLARAKDEFISVASHELRTPLTAIDGLMSMIRDGDYGKVNEPLKGPLEDIGSASERLIQLVNDLLRVSRIEAGRLKYDLKEVELKKTIDRVVDLLKVIAKEKKLSLKVEEMSDIRVLADEDKVEQVLNNLIGNSLKFTLKGEITIAVQIEDQFARVVVKDSGVGIKDEDREKLFKKFSQVNRNDQRSGTGLGLYIAKAVCQKMGGDLVLVSSEIGKGSVFAFTLPLAGSKVAERTKEIIEKEAKAHPDQKSDSIKVS